MNKKETWKPVKDYENFYIVSSFGRIKNIKTNKILKPWITQGYCHLRLCKNGKCIQYGVHKIVCESFIGKIKKHHQINHKNCIKNDNKIQNLEYVTHKQNIRHARINGLLRGPLGERQHMSKLKEKDIISIRNLYQKKLFSQLVLSKKFNVHQSNISYIVNKKSWRHIDG